MTFLLLVLQIAAAPSSDRGAIAGTILEAVSGRPLAGVLVLLSDLDRGVLSDSLGRYRLEGIPAGPQHLSARSMGFESRTLHALVPRQGVLEINLSLTPRPLPLGAIEVRAPVELPDRSLLVHEYPLTAICPTT
jgi:hypothetical protein